MHRRRVLQGLGLLGLASPFPAFANKEVAPKYLLLVQLRGGNDGLNTLTPFESDNYRRLRPSLGLRSNQVIPVGASIHEGALGLNSALARLVDQAGEQDLALITGVGYPAQDRSHFRSIQHWESGGDGSDREGLGNAVVRPAERTKLNCRINGRPHAPVPRRVGPLLKL